jgi:UTP--glucose-1-phosphate uridylyltransferase
MLPVVDKPLIQYAVEEAYEAGIRDMIFVTGRSKRAIEDHFDTAYELENELERRQAGHAGPGARRQPGRHELPVRAPAALAGPGPCRAVRRALVGNEPFAVILADDLMTGEPGGPGVMAQMTAASRSKAARCWPCRKCRWSTPSATASCRASPQAAR